MPSLDVWQGGQFFEKFVQFLILIDPSAEKWRRIAKKITNILRDLRSKISEKLAPRLS